MFLSLTKFKFKLLSENFFRFSGFAGEDLTQLGIPTDTKYMIEYCQRAGIPPVHNWSFYMAFSFFRVAAILQGVYKRAIEGKWMVDPSMLPTMHLMWWVK